MRFRDTAVSFAMALGLTVASGCGRGDPPRPAMEQVEMFPVGGRILVDGKPPAGALVVFHPADGSAQKIPRPRGFVATDGSFRLGTYSSDDGAPIGDYKVTVEWQPLVSNDGEYRAGPNALPAAFASPATTPLRQSVAAGDNVAARIDVPARR